MDSTDYKLWPVLNYLDQLVGRLSINDIQRSIIRNLSSDTWVANKLIPNPIIVSANYNLELLKDKRIR